MKIKDFVDEYKSIDSLMDQIEFIGKHVKSNYMEYLVKVAKAEDIIQRSCYVDNKFRINTPLMEYLVDVAIIEAYTDLEFTPELRMAEYDMLCECGIVRDFRTRDAKAFVQIVKDTLSDHRENYRSFAGYLDGKGEVLMSILDALDFGEVSEDGETKEESDY